LNKNHSIVIKPRGNSCLSHNVFFVISGNVFGRKNRLLDLLKFMKESYKSILLQQYINGTEYRIYFVGDEPIHLTKKIPPVLVGNGKSNIGELIDSWNKKIKSSYVQGELKFIEAPGTIKRDTALDSFLVAHNYSIQSVLDSEKN